MKLITRGIKGVDHELEVGRLTLLTGPNGSGKSTAADSVRFLALGFVPALGKRPVDTAALMANGSMSVELVLEDGRTMRRGLERTDKGFTQVVEASWIRNGKPAETSKAITGLFGTEEQDVAECLDIRELLSATPNHRAARIEQLLSAGQRSAEEAAKAVARWTVMRLADTTEERMPANYLEALPMVPGRQTEILKEVAPMLEAKLRDGGMSGAIHWANEEKRAAATGLQKKEGAAYELRKRAAQVREPDSRDVERLEAERARLQKEVGALQERASAWARTTAARRQLEAAIAQVREMAGRTNQVAQDAEAVHGKRILDLESKRTELPSEIPAPTLTKPMDVPALKAMDVEISHLEAEHDTIEIPELLNTDQEEAQVARLEADLARAKASPWAEVLKVADDLEDAGTTKGVKTAIAKPVKRLRELARQGMGTGLVELEHELDRARVNIREALEKSDKRHATRQKAISRKKELFDQIRAKYEVYNKAREAHDQAQDALMVEFDRKRAEISAERQTLEAAIATNRKSLEAVRGEKASVDRRLASLQDQLAGTQDPGVQPVGLEGLQTKAAAVAAELRGLVEAQAVYKEIQLAIDAIEEAKASREVYTAIEWAFLRQREVEISESGGRLLRFVTDFLEGAGRKDVPFIRAASGICSIGWKTEAGKEVQVQALSGGEWCLYAAALTSAVLLARASALKVLLVEAGETDDRHLLQLLAGVQRVAADGIGLSAALVMTPRRPGHEPAGWTVVSTEMAKV